MWKKMSIFFQTNKTNTLLLKANSGYSTRNFKKYVNVISYTNYFSSLFLIFDSGSRVKLLPNRITPMYRNHFTMFKNDETRTLIIVKVESTLIFPDNDVILEYDCITFPDDDHVDEDGTKSLSSCTFKKWYISFDKNIKYSSKEPESFKGFRLLCSGEWWCFEHGIILNGKTSYVEGTEIGNLFIYYELHPKEGQHVLKSGIQQQQTLEQNQRILDLSSRVAQRLSNTDVVGNLYKNTIAAAAADTIISPQIVTTTTMPILQQQQQPSQMQNNKKKRGICNLKNKLCSILAECDAIDLENNQIPTNINPTTSHENNNDTNLTVNESNTLANELQNDDLMMRNTTTAVTIPITPTTITPITATNTNNDEVTKPTNNTIKDLILRNDNVKRIKRESLIPSQFWFEQRSIELENNDISYFIPFNNPKW